MDDIGVMKLGGGGGYRNWEGDSEQQMDLMESGKRWGAALWPEGSIAASAFSEMRGWLQENHLRRCGVVTVESYPGDTGLPFRGCPAMSGKSW